MEYTPALTPATNNEKVSAMESTPTAPPTPAANNDIVFQTRESIDPKLTEEESMRYQVRCPFVVACRHMETLKNLFVDCFSVSTTDEKGGTIVVWNPPDEPTVLSKTSTNAHNTGVVAMKHFVQFALSFDQEQSKNPPTFDTENFMMEALLAWKPFFEQIDKEDALRWKEHIALHPEDDEKHVVDDSGIKKWPAEQTTEQNPHLYLCDFLHAASYWDFSFAKEAGCKHLAATYIDGKSTEEIQDALHIHDDMTKEDREMIDAKFND